MNHHQGSRRNREPHFIYFAASGAATVVFVAMLVFRNFLIFRRQAIDIGSTLSARHSCYPWYKGARAYALGFLPKHPAYFGIHQELLPPYLISHQAFVESAMAPAASVALSQWSSSAHICMEEYHCSQY